MDRFSTDTNLISTTVQHSVISQNKGKDIIFTIINYRLLSGRPLYHVLMNVPTEDTV